MSKTYTRYKALTATTNRPTLLDSRKPASNSMSVFFYIKKNGEDTLKLFTHRTHVFGHKLLGIRGKQLEILRPGGSFFFGNSKKGIRHNKPLQALAAPTFSETNYLELARSFLQWGQKVLGISVGHMVRYRCTICPPLKVLGLNSSILYPKAYFE